MGDGWIPRTGGRGWWHEQPGNQTGTIETGTGNRSSHTSSSSCSFGSFSSLQFSLHSPHMFGNIEPIHNHSPGGGSTELGKAKQRTIRNVPITDNNIISCEPPPHPQLLHSTPLLQRRCQLYSIMLLHEGKKGRTPSENESWDWAVEQRSCNCAAHH